MVMNIMNRAGKVHAYENYNNTEKSTVHDQRRH